MNIELLSKIKNLLEGVEKILDRNIFNSFIEEHDIHDEIIELIKISYDFDLPNSVNKIINKYYYNVNEFESLKEIITSHLEIDVEKAEQLIESLLFLLDENRLVDYYFETAENKYYSKLHKDIIKAQSLLEKSINLFPEKSIKTYELLGNIYNYKLNDYEKALCNFNFVYSNDPQKEFLNGKIGQIYHYNLKNYDLAVSFYNKEIELYPEEILPYQELINLYEFLKNERMMEDTIKKLVKANIYPDFSFNCLYDYFYKYDKVIYFTREELTKIIYYNHVAEYLMLIQKDYKLASLYYERFISSINDKFNPDSKYSEIYCSDSSYEKAVLNYTFLNTVVLNEIDELIKLYLFKCWFKTTKTLKSELSENSLDEKEIVDIIPLIKNHLVNLFYCYPDEFKKAFDSFYPIKDLKHFIFRIMLKFYNSIQDSIIEEKINYGTYFYKYQYSGKDHKNNKSLFENYFSDLFYKKAKQKEDSYKYKEAITYINISILAKPEDEINYFIRGKYYCYLSNFNLAIKDFNKAIILKPNQEYVLLWKGYSNYYMDNYEDAIVDFSKAIKINPFMDAGYEYRAKARFIVKDFYGCINDCDLLIKKNINVTSNLVLRGKSYFSIHNKKKGLSDFSKASELGDKEAFKLIKEYSSDKT